MMHVHGSWHIRDFRLATVAFTRKYSESRWWSDRVLFLPNLEEPPTDLYVFDYAKSFSQCWWKDEPQDEHQQGTVTSTFLHA